MAVLSDLAEKRRLTPPRPSGEFASFLTDIASAVAQHVEQWRHRVSEAIAYWSGEGYRTGLLERALHENAPANGVESFLREFEGRVARMRDLERQVSRADASMAIHPVFRDPERLDEAEQVLERALKVASPPPGVVGVPRSGFEVGGSNQMAVRAATRSSARRAPLQPVFIHGPAASARRTLNAIGHGLAPATAGAGRWRACRAQLSSTS
jgi:hypothetical protein